MNGQLLWSCRPFVMLRRMVIDGILLEDVNQGNETFRITENLDSELLTESIREVGQISPILLLEKDGQNIVVCGFRRIRAIERTGTDRVLARFVRGKEALDAFRVALWDNLSHRTLEPLEKARVLFKLKNSFAVPPETLIRAYLPLLGLNPHESVLRTYLLLNDVRPALRQCFSEGCLTQASIAALAELPPGAQDRFGQLMKTIHLSASLQRKMLELLKEISSSRGVPILEPLDSSDISEILHDDRLSPYQKGDRVYDSLYRIRNPRLAQARDLFEIRRKELSLPGSIQITSHPFFEEPGVRIEFAAPNAERFRDLARKLHKVSQGPELDELFCV